MASPRLTAPPMTARMTWVNLANCWEKPREPNILQNLQPHHAKPIFEGERLLRRCDYLLLLRLRLPHPSSLHLGMCQGLCHIQTWYLSKILHLHLWIYNVHCISTDVSSFMPCFSILWVTLLLIVISRWSRSTNALSSSDLEGLDILIMTMMFKIS